MRRLTKNSSIRVTIINSDGKYVQVSNYNFENETSLARIIYLAKCAISDNHYRKGIYTISISDRNDTDYYFSKKIRIN